MDVEIELPARAAGIVADQPGFVSFVHSALQAIDLVMEFAAHVAIGRMGAHGEGRDQGAFDELMRLGAHDFAVLAGAGLALVRVDDKVMRPGTDLLGHEGPLHARGKAGTTAPAQARFLHLVDDLVAAQFDQLVRAVPVAARAGTVEPGAIETVDIGEDTILVGKHQSSPPALAARSG